ncbi:alpha/beta fold hydrolase [Streptomyces sp. NPDC059740]|uniref:alpha/beta fold hydrolase n=1 Tax=Streptomyces sp. NPDC059740 TaxID=3346926 RepID=UPI00364D7F7D
MSLRSLRLRGRRLYAVLTALVVLAGGLAWSATALAEDPAPVHRTDQVLHTPAAPGSEQEVSLDTSFFTAGGPGRRPAVLLGHGFGGSKDDVRAQAEHLARAGYAVLTWSARGFGRSTGKIGLNDPDGEVADVRHLVDWLARRPQVRLDKAGDPRVGVAGASYGGAVSLLAAGYDRRVDAIAPSLTYWNLADALFPHGVFKKLWTQIFFTTGAAGPAAGTAPGTATGTDTTNAGGSGGTAGAGDTGGAAGTDAPGGAASTPAPGGTAAGGDGSSCARFEDELCAMYRRVAVSGKPDAAARALLTARSPSAVADRIKVPTLITQGQTDSLFPLDQADAMARAIARGGAPVDVDWTAGGHDGGDTEAARVLDRTTTWFDRYLKGDRSVDTGPAFRVSRTGGVDSTNGSARLTGASADRYPGLSGDPRTVRLSGVAQTFANPAGAGPPAISTVPGVGALSSLSAAGAGLSLDIPGEYAHFDTRPLTSSVRVTGEPTVRVKVGSSTGEAVLFAKLYDVSADGRQQVLPHQLVVPYRLTGVKEDAGRGGGRTVTLRLPAVDHAFAAGHRLRVVLSATDLAYASPVEPATYHVALAPAGSRTAAGTAPGTLSLPTAPRLTGGAGALPAWTWWLPLGCALLAALLLLTGRRRTAAPAPDPALARVPVQITGLSKRYAGSADRYAVREVSFRVEQGQVLGLLGPNGAGKTTTLRMLMGLIRPDAGEIRVFGQAVRPGAPVLSRVGAFVEGAGFLPHLSGRENLELYWRATARPPEDAHFDQALEIAGLGDALDRAVRTYSQGMRQRLAIAQAMLGLPDLLILDEPTNGLDPPQIREMRGVMTRYAAAGRTVVVSSHLLAEVEQTCTHLVVMDRGRLVQAGPVGEIVGVGDTLLVGTAEPVPEAVAQEVAALPGVASATPAEEGLLVRPDGSASTSEILAGLVRLKVPVERVGPHRRLEDAFLTLIGGER